MATIHDVAREAGVSAATVSHVINDSRAVAAETRRRVEEAVHKLRYRRDGIARSLRRSRTGTIGLVISDITSPYYAELMRGVEDAVSSREEKYNVILCNTDGNIGRERTYLNLLLEKRVDGIIMTPAGGNVALLEEVVSDGFAVVFADRELPGIAVDRVVVDNYGAAREAVTHLIGLGYASIATLRTGRDVSTINERVRGYRDALAAAGRVADEQDICVSAPTIAGAHAAGLRLLDRPRRPDAVFCVSELMTIGLMRAVAERRLRCPEDVAVVGFDDFPWAAAFRPRLTAVAQPAYATGGTAADLLFERITEGRGIPPRRVVLPTELNIRESCGAALAAGRLAGAAAE
jgi:LacI family transcriptional regulator